MAARVEITGNVAERIRALAGTLRATSAKAVEVVPADADALKAIMLVKQERNVFEVDRDMEESWLRAFDEEAQEQVERVMDGKSGSIAACLKAAGDDAKETVQARLDDKKPTPGGKAALSERYAAWKAQHYPGKPIGVASGDLRNHLVVRLVGR